MHQQKVSHQKLDGLTRATAVIAWMGECGHEVHLHESDYPVHPVDKFVELTADLPRGPVRTKIDQTLPWWTASEKLTF
jgi:hypothetical protein